MTAAQEVDSAGGRPAYFLPTGKLAARNHRAAGFCLSTEIFMQEISAMPGQ